MLKKIVWCLKEKCEDNLMGMLPLPKEGVLYLSDDAEILAFIQSQGCYTVAVYHEGVSGILSGTQYAVEGTKEIEGEYLQKVYQRFAGKPWDITQTDRCTIREMSVADVDDLYELYESPLVTRYMEGLFLQKEQEIQYIQDYIKNVYEYYGFGTWLIHRKEDGRLIGRAGFHYRPGFDEVELGFIIGQPYWRMGYAYEVCSHLMEMGKSLYEFDKVQALVKKENEASVHLLKKLGFHFEEEIVLEGEEYQRYLA
jgi:RimJ/RimL family protein N-acetyltransferase